MGDGRTKEGRLRSLAVWLAVALLIETGALVVFLAHHHALSDQLKESQTHKPSEKTVVSNQSAAQTTESALTQNFFRLPDFEALLNSPAVTAFAGRPSWIKLPDGTARRDWKYIVVHHSATAGGSAEAFEAYHRTRGMVNGLAYHFVIDNGSQDKPDGGVEVGGRWVSQLPGGHCRQDSVNQQAIGICLVGDFTKARPSDKQLDTLARLVFELQKQFAIPSENVVGHGRMLGEFSECPGKSFPWESFQVALQRAVDAERQTVQAAFSAPLRLPPVSAYCWSGQFPDGE